MDIKIVTFTKKHIHEILLISEEQVGKNFINHSYLEFFLNNPDAEGLVAVIGKEVVGFTFFQWCTVEELKRYILVDKKWLKKIFRNVSLAGYRNLTAVKKEFQNKGVGRMLVNSSIKELKKRSDVLANVVWRAHRKKNLQNSLEKHGMVCIRTIRNYWREDSLKRKYECAVCGAPPCKCTADIYTNFISR